MDLRKGLAFGGAIGLAVGLVVGAFSGDEVLWTGICLVLGITVGGAIGAMAKSERQSD